MVKNLFIFGGAPRTGKSTTAKSLAKELNITYLSFDDLSSLLQVLKPKDIPKDIFYDENLEIDEFYKKYPEPKEVFELERKKCEAAHIGIYAILENFYDWESLIIEGIGITPILANNIKTNYNLNLESFFLAAKNSDILTKRIYTNGLWDNEDAYPDKYKEIEKVWTSMYNDWFIEEANKYSQKLIYIDDKAIQEIVLEIKPSISAYL